MPEYFAKIFSRFDADAKKEAESKRYSPPDKSAQIARRLFGNARRILRMPLRFCKAQLMGRVDDAMRLRALKKSARSKAFFARRRSNQNFPATRRSKPDPQRERPTAAHSQFSRAAKPRNFTPHKNSTRAKFRLAQRFNPRKIRGRRMKISASRAQKNMRPPGRARPNPKADGECVAQSCGKKARE